LVRRATLLAEETKPARPRTPRAAPQGPAPSRLERNDNADSRLNDVSHALHCFHLLLRAHRLYEPAHPQLLDSLDAAYDALKNVASELGGLEVSSERGGIVVRKLLDAHLPDARGEFFALSSDLARADIQTLFFAEKFHVGELDTLARLTKDTLLRSEESSRGLGRSWWPTQLREQRVQGIQVNTLTERKVDSILASLIAALVAYGGNAPLENGDAPICAPQSEELAETLGLLVSLLPWKWPADSRRKKLPVPSTPPWKAPAAVRYACSWAR
jgi:hypothetical protein